MANLHLIGKEVASAQGATSQVYKLTHTSEGKYTSYLDRSFISFSYDGRNIEDFNLIVSFPNGRLEKIGYASFEDVITSYEGNDGQMYWGFNYQANQLSLTLATDAMSQLDLDDFLRWFAPGAAKELILAEHPNRIIMARVSEPPTLSLLPIQNTQDRYINGRLYPTTIAFYRGEIILNFVMDDPHWYAKQQFLGVIKEDGTWEDTWEDANGETVDIYNSLDAKKIITEDGVPTASMLGSYMLLGDSLYYDETTSARVNSAHVGVTSNPDLDITTDPPNPEPEDTARIMDMSFFINQGINLPANEDLYFYYAGTAPERPVLQFSLQPTIDTSTYYIVTPVNKYNNPNKPYNNIIIESVHKKVLRFSTPGVMSAYNEAINLFSTIGANVAWIDVRTLIRTGVKHTAVREWANKVIDYVSTNISPIITTATALSNAIRCMAYMFMIPGEESLGTLSLVIDNSKGIIEGQVFYRTITDSLPSTVAAWATYGNYSEHTENMGDMVQSNYLIIEDRNYPVVIIDPETGEKISSGTIMPWTEEQPTNSHRLYHDVTGGLNNLLIDYKYHYL